MQEKGAFDARRECVSLEFVIEYVRFFILNSCIYGTGTYTLTALLSVS